MDADLAITIAFASEVLVFAVGGGLLVAREVRKSRSPAAGEQAREVLRDTAPRGQQRPSSHESLGVRGGRS
jgi:hypothetical protein